jgi:hypothetical protein
MYSVCSEVVFSNSACMLHGVPNCLILRQNVFIGLWHVITFLNLNMSLCQG